MRILHSRSHSQDEADAFWRTHYRWLASRGYALRSKYAASWIGSSTAATGGAGVAVPDLERGVIVDAIRTIDGMAVALKRIRADSSPAEFNLARYFWSLKPSARNHCVPILDIMSIPGDEKTVLIVMPLLKAFDELQFKTFGEAVAFFTQIFEGLHFMHETAGIAHRQIEHRHIMMDATPLYSHPYDPTNPAMRRDWQGRARPRMRTHNPVRYYFVDFACASSSHTKDSSITQAQCAADIYDVGDVIRTNFFNRYDGFQFMYPILADMLEPDLAKRPSAERLYAHFLMVRNQLPNKKLRARLVERGGEPLVTAAYRDCRHWFLVMGRLLMGIPVVPDA